MSQETVKYNRSFAGSIGAGMKSVFAGKGRRYYELVHKTRSKYHQEGAVQKIIIDNIEIGRDPKCQVRFDESFTTVSRRHAAIVKDGEGWKLVQLSKTNSTYLNGNKVSDSWYLQSGDEIQLSTGGPKMGFVVPQGDAGLVKSIGLTNRLNLFRQQALRPWKTVTWSLLGGLVAACLVGGYFLFDLNKKNVDLTKKYDNAVAEAARRDSLNQVKMQNVVDSLSKVKLGLEQQVDDMRKKLKSNSAAISGLKQQVTPASGSNQGTKPGASSAQGMKSIEQCFPFVYYIQTEAFEITYPDGKVEQYKCGENDAPGWSGTGFLLNDGRFVTARHVIEGWQFWKSSEGEDPDMLYMNTIVNNGGKVRYFFNCFSPSGANFSCCSEDFKVNRSQDQGGITEDGIRFTHGVVATDFAYIRTGLSGGLAFDDVKCDQLKVKTELTVLGFPLGEGVNSINDIKPIYGNATVASEGLQRGRILTTNTNTEHGNSGGPVFYNDEKGDFVVVGIVSGGRGTNLGNIIPMSRVR